MKTLLLFLTLCGMITASYSCTSDSDCSIDQTCGASTSTCSCNTTYYKRQDFPPSPNFECTANTLFVDILKCQLEKSSYLSTNVHLNNESCIGEDQIFNNSTAKLIFRRPLKEGDCGTILKVNNSFITYSNTLYISAKASNIVSKNNVTISLSCSFPVNITAALNVSLNPKLGFSQIIVPEMNAVLSVSMEVNINPEFTILVNDQTVLKVEDPLYVSVKIPYLDADFFSVSVVNIYASPLPSGVSPVYIFTDSCPIPDYDGLVTVVRNGFGTEARFILKVFKISGYDTLSLFADVKICNGTCPKDCSSRSSGQAREGGNIATVKVPDLSAERIDYSGAFERFSMSWTLSSLLMSLLFLKLM
ncbi:uromodulin-like [Bombina bombina]|uniref:uromodulin-like n=1 Tax=Bombina bombina TaxID=8345 RepID=UPI00235AD4BC|nr:uromodulin-like [Bombina bombina]